MANTNYKNFDIDTMLSVEEAEKLPTHRLLAYYRSISRYESPELKEAYTCGCCCTNCKKNIERHKEREEYRAKIKAILDTRENIL